MANDLSETKNVATDHSGKVKELIELWNVWARKVRLKV